MDRLIRLLALAGFLAFPLASQAQTPVCGTVSTCPNASTPLGGTELLYLVQSGVSKKITVSSLFSGFFNFPLAIDLGGTGNTTANGALGSTGLNAYSQTAAGASNFTIPVTARTVLVGGISSAVTYSLPLAANYPPGFPLIIADYLGNVTSSNTVTAAAQGSDTVNGGASLETMQSAFSSMTLESDGVSHWFTVGGGGAGGSGSSTPPEDWCSPAASGCGSNSFTPGTTTSLTLSVTPPGGANQLNIYYDGVHLNSTMWSLSGNVVNFLTPITAQYVVEITYNGGGSGGSGTVTSVGLSFPSSVFSVSGSPVDIAGTLTGAFVNQNANTFFAGPSSGSAATPGFRTLTSADLPAATAGSSVINVLPNTQFQAWTTNGPSVEQLSNGTGPETSSSCTGFSTTNNAPTFVCPNTEQIQVGDIVVTSNNAAFWSFAGIGVIGCAQVECIDGLVVGSRVDVLTANTSMVIQGYFGGVSPGTSAAETLTPLAPGGTGGVPDGWDSTGSLNAYADKWPVNAYPGQIRPVLLRKGITGSEIFEYTAPTQGMGRFQGQTITCGGVVWQKLQQGSGTWEFYISDNVNGTTNSSMGTGESYSGPHGGYQFLTVTHTISQTATNWKFGLNTLGNAGDIYYGAGPFTCVPGTVLAQNQLAQKPNETIRAGTHWNPPLLTPLIITFPNTQIVSGSGFYGWNYLDIQAISLGLVDSSIGDVYAKIEWTTSTVGAYILCADQFNVNGTTFGPETITNVAGVANVASNSRWPMAPVSAFSTPYPSISMVTTASGLVPTSGTWDFGDIEAVLPTNVQ